MRIVYRDKDGQVEKIITAGRSYTEYEPDPDKYHEHINRTYYTLECQGKLNDMSAGEKQWTKDLHVMAQDPGYWKE